MAVLASQRNPHWMHWLRRLALVLALGLLGACTSLPPRRPPAPSHALSDTADTTLARIAAASRPAGETAPSGFRLLPTGEFAFHARVALARHAERSLDVQYYHIHRDDAGRALLRALRDAALRGVRVRLLVDDFHATQIDDLLAGLAAHPNVQVRLFNPLSLRWGPPVARLVFSRGDFQQNNHRMHNKLFVADNAIALYGGRNVADEYFMSHREANFVDMDVLSTGKIVPELSAVFDRYWNSEQAWPLHDVRARPLGAGHARAQFDAEVREAAPALASYRLGPLGHTGIDVQLAEGRLALVHADAQVHADPPDKAADAGTLQRPTAAMQGLLDAIVQARQRVVIVSPYFVPGEIGIAMMRDAAQRGVQMVLLTNSLGSTDEPLVHDRYSRYRVEMLRLGVEIHEFNPTQARRARGLGSFGQSRPRLHAKVSIVDRRRLLVGSVNLDARSAIGNTEMAVVIDSPVLAEVLGATLGAEQFASMYRLRLRADGQSIEWITTDDRGQPQVLHEEPEGSAWLRLKLWLQSLLVDERLL